MFKEHHLPAEYFYRPQTKFAKVMFSQVPVCPREGGGLCPQGVSVHRRSLSTGGLCLQGVSVQGSVSRGVSVQGVSVQGFSVQEGLCPGESLSREGLCPGKPPCSNKWAVRILLECILVWKHENELA